MIRHRSVLVALFIFLGCIAGHFILQAAFSNSKKHEVPPRNFLSVMDQGIALEKQKQYNQAISVYRQAFKYTDTLYPDLVINAKIAIHNRIATCYKKKGDIDAAIREYTVSQQLGDEKYAPKAVKELSHESKENTSSHSNGG